MDIVPGFKTEKYQWLKSQKSIDLLSLDDEIMRIPVLVQECGEITATAIEIRESAKDELERIESIVSSEVRANGKSETAIVSIIASDERVISAKIALSESRLDAGLWQSMMECLRTKSSNLRVAADLITSGWLTSSSVLEKRRKELRERPS